MQTTNFNFENDKILAKHAYAMAEKFIRSCESANTINSNNKLNSIKGDVIVIPPFSETVVRRS